MQLTLVDQGVDVLLKGVRGRRAGGDRGADRRSRSAHGLARLSVDQGLGPETLYEPEPATVTLSGMPVRVSASARFLQATEDGEAALVAAVREAVGGRGARSPTCSPASAPSRWRSGAAYAAEASRDAAAALKRAAPNIDGRASRPLSPAARRRRAERVRRGRCSIRRAPAPRSRSRALAASAVPRIAYVSCNPATFARDAKMLVDGGYTLDWVKPVGQFRWSTHVELAACFSR